MHAYDQLRHARAAHDKARQRVDQAAARHSEVLSLHREANAQLNQLKDRFVEVLLPFYMYQVFFKLRISLA